jgi:ParB/RepB/Spo0J family partition protein
MENVLELRETKRTDLLLIDPNRIVVKEGFNVRQDFGDLDELMNSIIENGLRVPLRGYKDGEIFILTDGERRLKAIKMAIKKGADIKFVEMRTEPKGYNEEKRIFDLILCNDGKKLTPIEECKVYERLVNFHYTPEEISKKIGKSVAHIYNMLKLMNAPKEVQDLIGNNEISTTAATSIIRHTDDAAEQVKLVKEAVQEAKKENKKATGKHLKKEICDKTNNKVVFKFLFYLYEKLEKEGVKNEKTELLYEMISGVKSKKTLNEMAELFV